MSELLAPRLATVGTPPATAEISPTRDLRLDLFRGLSLILIFIDHIPQNVLGYFTLQSIQFFDAAEIFIFISGYTAAIVYGRALNLHGPIVASAQILRRAWQLYVAHIFLFMIFLAEVSYTVMSFNNPMYNEEMRVGEFLVEPHIAVIKALLLQFQPTFLDILPLYIVLLVAFPLVLTGLRLRPVIVLLGSLALYIAVQFTDLSLPAYPAGREWYFNPLAWQFLFVAGAALSLHKDWVACRFRRQPWLLPLAAIIIGAAGIIRLSWTIHGLWDAIPGLLLADLWPVDKTDLSPIRLIPFFAAVALIAAWISPDARGLRSSLARPLVLCGRHSLEIFCLGILLSVLGHFLLSEYSIGIIGQLGVNAAGILAMCLTAKVIDWYRKMSRMPWPPPMVPPATREG